MSKANLFWLLVAISLALLLLFLCNGCLPDGHTSTRQVTQMRCHDDGIREGYFAYYGFYDGDFRIIKVAGLSMAGQHHHPACYWVPCNGGTDYETRHAEGDVQYNMSGLKTKANGVCTVTGRRDKWGADPKIYWLCSSTTLEHPRNPMIDGSFTYSTMGSEGWEGASAYANASLSTTDIDQIVARSSLPEEQFYLSTPTESPPTTGIEKITSTLAQQSGEMGTECVNALDCVVPNFTDTHESYFKNGCPVFYSVIIKSAEPVVFGENDVFAVNIRTHTDTAECDIYWYGSNADKMTHVFRTELFYAVDKDSGITGTVQSYDNWTPFDTEPNLWDSDQYAIEKRDNWLSCVDPNLYSDPNVVPDPNCFYDPTCPCMNTFTNRLDVYSPIFESVMLPHRVLDVPVIRMDTEGDTLYYEFDEKQLRVLLKAIDEGWLQSNANYDINNDGIVNLMDLK